MTTEILDEGPDSHRTVSDKPPLKPLPRPRPIDRKERTLDAREARILADARAGKRTEEMAGWTFRIGMQGLGGRRAYQVRPWEHDHWFFVEWCPSALMKASQAPVDSPTTGFDHL